MKQREESVKLTLNFYNKWTWPIEVAESLLEVRQYLSESTMLSVYQNYHFEYKGERVNEYVEHQVPDGSMLQIVLDEFNERTARFHIKKVQEMMQNLSLYQNTKRDEFPQQVSKFAFETRELQLNDGLQQKLTPELILIESQKPQKPLLHELQFSVFNPPRSSRRLKGDLFYLKLRTLENVEYHITANNTGFYINSSRVEFDPTPKSEPYHNLFDLIEDHSASFKKELNQQRPEHHKIDIPTIYKYNYKWLCSSLEPQTADAQKSENWALDLHGFDLSSLRDWNEELQVFRSLPRQDLIQKLNRDKALVKVYQDFAEAAVKGAMAVVDKVILPLNPMDTENQQVYVFNQIFFSFAMETPEDFRQESGPDATPTVSTTNCDFRNLQILHRLDIPNLNVLNTCLIDYKGRRVIAQSIIPGILNSDHSNCTQYGSIDDGKTIQKNEEFHKLMTKVSEYFHLENEVTFLDGANQEYSMAGSIEVKGILGSDKRMYLLDLLRLSPRDLNYLGDNNQCCVLRYELLQNYWVLSTLHKIKSEDQSLTHLLNQKSTLKLNSAIETKTTLKSVPETQHQELLNLAKFLLNQAIPQLVAELQQQEQGKHQYMSISDMFHSHGVNMRYLGRVNSLISNDLPSVKLTLERVILVKSLKHIFREAMREAPTNRLSEVICHMLNTVFYSVKPEEKKKSSKKAKKAIPQLIKKSEYKFLTRDEIWEKVAKISQLRYGQELKKMSELPFHCVSVLRELCQSIGLVLVARERTEFTEDDIAEIRPVIKAIEQQSEDAKLNMEIGQKYLSENVQNALEAYLTATQIIMNLHGSMHRDLANCFSKMSGVYFRRSEFEPAISFQRQAITIYAHIYGIDHSLTISALTGLSLYYFASKQYSIAFNFMIQCLYLSGIVNGESQETYNQFTNLSLLYSENKQHQNSLNCLFEALERCETLFKTFDALNTSQYKLRTCGYYSAIALEHAEIGDAHRAVEFQEKSLELLKNTVQPADNRVKESEALLAQLKQALHEKKYDQKKPVQRPFGTNRVQQVQQPQIDDETDKEREVLLQKLKVAKQNMKSRGKQYK